MKFFNGLKVFGDVNFRDKACPYEDAELRTIISDLKNNHPLGHILKHVIFHTPNEGVRNGDTAKKLKAKGALVKGIVDVVGIGNPMLVMEVKREDHTESSYEPRQEELLKIAHNAGCFACVVLGHKGAQLAIEEWLKLDPLKIGTLSEDWVKSEPIVKKKRTARRIKAH